MFSQKIKEPANLNFFYLGKEIKIIQSFDLFLSRHKISFKEGKLFVSSPQSAKDEINIIFDAWLKHLAKKYITARTRQFSIRYGFSIGKVIIRGQKTRWGSCSARRNLSFNYRLMKYREEVIDYVIIHEMCHLKEMNHSKRFWALVENLCPNFKSLKKELKSPQKN